MKYTLLIILLAFFIILHTGSSETNNVINYSDLSVKEITISKLEDLYFLKVSKSVRLTGQNLIDLNSFSNIQTVRTYTTIKIEF
jgi:hypothetical protein